jgi:N-acetylglucosamine kinase-like BadF-type ATPase
MALDPQGRVCGQGSGPPALVDPSNPGAAADAIVVAVEEAMAEARATLPVAALWVGLAGAGRAGAREAVEIALRSRRLAREVRVGMDVEAAHRDAFGAGAGVLLVVGTGSMLWGRDPEGREVRVGGWGSWLGDEGSGFWLGLHGLRAVAAAADGRGPSTALTPTLLEALRLPDPQALVPWVASARKGEVAALAPRVLQEASRGDAAAVAVVAEAVAGLGRHLVVARRAWEPWGSPFPVALTGGLAEGSGPLRPHLVALVRELGGALRSEPVVAARGAAHLAMELPGRD